MTPAPSWSPRTGVAQSEAPPDTGCDWQRVDPRFARCVSCPLPRCRYDYPVAEQSAAAKLLQAVLSHDPHSTHQRSPAAPQQRPKRKQAEAIAVALPAEDLARIAHQALVRGRSRP